MTAPAKLDTADLVRQVKALYRQVAQQPSATYHFPLGRPLAEQLGYPAELLDRIFAAALLVGDSGQVTGVDMTDEQRAKADRLRAGALHIRFVPGRLEDLPFGDASFDVVISNGVVNLCPDKARVFAEAARVLAPGGRLAMADIVATRPLPETVTCNADLWSACIGGAAPEADYRAA